MGNELMQIANEENSHQMRLIAGYQLSLLHFYLNKFQDGLNAAVDPIGQAERYGMYRAAVVANEAASRIHFVLGDLEQAEHFAKRSLFFAEETGMKARVAKAYIGLFNIAQLRGDFEAAMEYSRLVLENSDSAYIRPWGLAARARAISDAEEAGKLFREADSILGADSSTGQNHFYVRIYQIEDGVARENWQSVEEAARKLEEFTQPEPLPWTDFHIKRGRVIAKWGRGKEDETYAKHLADLRKTREETGMVIWLPGD